MRKIILLLVFWLLSVAAYSQLEVKAGSFKEVLGFVNINTDIYDDDNGVLYAVIKVNTVNINDKQRRQLSFQGNESTFIELEYKVGEVWVYLSSKPATYLKISHPDFGSTEFWFPFDLEPKKGYEMVLVNKSSSEPSGYGSLTVTTKPESGATILLNGKASNVKTPYTNDMMAAGQYEITVSKERYKSVTQTISIVDGEKLTVELDMPIDVADITINADELTDVYIDGVLKKTGAWTGELYSGQHKVSLKKALYYTLEKDINVEGGKHETYNFELMPINGKISITSKPSGATVFIDEKEYGTTPLEVDDVMIGKHELKMTKDGWRTLRKRFDLTDGVVTELNETLEDYPEGVIRWWFSVSPTDKVYFSKGNLQYQASTKTWRFAETQWDFIGDANKNISPKYSGWIDLFGWGTGSEPTKTTTNESDYVKFSDWGDNPIRNGGNKAKVWRTLTRDEWEYVFSKRETVSGIRYAKAKVNGVDGAILLPDSWDKKTYKLKQVNKTVSDYNDNKISLSDWKNLFESNGAVFLPKASIRVEHNYIDHEIRVNSGHFKYWSSTSYKFVDVDRFDNQVVSGDHRGCDGYSVRLVCSPE